MTLPKSGVQLVAEGSANFYRDLARGDQFLATFGQSATISAAGVDQLGKAAQSIRLDTLNKQLDDQRTRLGVLGQSLTETTAKYGAGSVQAQSKAAALERLTGQMSLTQDKILLLSTAMDREAAAMKQAVDPNEELRKAVSESAKAAEDAAPRFSSFSEIAIGGLRRLGEIGVNALASLGGKFMSFAGDSVKVAGDYEAALNRFSAVTGGQLTNAGTTIDTFSAKFLQLGADTQFSAKAAADAAVELAKGGVPVRDILGSAAEATLNLASAAEMELAPAAEIVAKQLGVWGKDGVNATMIVDSLAQAANASTVDVDDLALGLANVGGSARVAGLGFRETVTTLGILAPGFSSAADAGTSLKTFLARLPGTTGPAIKAMTDLGLYTRETGSAFYDANGNFVGMQDAAALLQKATANLSEEQKSLAFNVIFGQDAIRTAAALAEGGAEQFDTFAGSMDAVGSAADQAKLRNQGFNFAMETLGGSVETLQIAIGQKLLPILTAIISDAIIPAVNAATSLAQNFGGVAETVGDFVVPALATATTAFILFNIQAAGGAIAALGQVGLALALAANQFITAGLAAGKAALAFAAANAPLLIIAASIGGVVWAFGQYNDAVDNFIAKAKEYSRGYQSITAANDAANAALDRATNLSQGHKDALITEQTELNRLKGEYDTFVESIANADDLTEEQAVHLRELDQAMTAQSTKVTQLSASTDALSAANAKNNQAMLDSTMGLVQASGGWGSYNEQVRLSEEVMKEALATMQKVREDGVGVFDSITQSRVDYQASMEQLTADHEAKMAKLTEDGNQQAIDAEVASFRAQQEQASLSYMEQQAAQRAHLGQMLIDYINAQAQLNPEFRKASGQLIGAISEEYGVQTSLSDQLFGSMLNDIDEYAKGGKGSVDELIGKLRENEQAATDTQQDMDALAKDYTATLTANFNEKKIEADDLTTAIEAFPAIKNTDLLTNFLQGKIDAQQLLAEINKLPSQKSINIHTSYTYSGDPPPVGKGGAIAMASGGIAKRGQPILVGDGPGGRLTPYSELIVPNQDVRVYNNRETRGIFGGARASRQPERRALGDPASIEQAKIDRHFDDQRRRAEEDKIDLRMAERDQRAYEDRKFGELGAGLQRTESTLAGAIQMSRSNLAEDLGGALGQALGASAPRAGSPLSAEVLAGLEDIMGRVAGRSRRQPISAIENASNAGIGTAITNVENRTYNYNPTYLAPPRSPTADFRMMEAFG